MVTGMSLLIKRVFCCSRKTKGGGAAPIFRCWSREPMARSMGDGTSCQAHGRNGCQHGGGLLEVP